MEKFKHFEFEVLSKSRKKVKGGDVFVMKLKSYDVYFYGKVIADDIKYCGNYANMVVLYKTPTQGLIIPDNMDINDIFIPFICGSSCWQSGYFKTVCNIPVSYDESNMDCGFFGGGYGKLITSADVESYREKNYVIECSGGKTWAIPYVDCYGNVLDHKPSILCPHDGLMLISGFESEISKHLCKNPDVKQKYEIL